MKNNMELYFEGVVYVNGTIDKPYYSINIAQKNKKGEEYFYVNIFWDRETEIPEHESKIRGKGKCRLFRDRNTNVVRMSISDAIIIENLGKNIPEAKIQSEMSPYAFEEKKEDDNMVNIDDAFEDKIVEDFAFDDNYLD